MMRFHVSKISSLDIEGRRNFIPACFVGKYTASLFSSVVHVSNECALNTSGAINVIVPRRSISPVEQGLIYVNWLDRYGTQQPLKSKHEDISTYLLGSHTHSATICERSALNELSVDSSDLNDCSSDSPAPFDSDYFSQHLLVSGCKCHFLHHLCQFHKHPRTV